MQPSCDFFAVLLYSKIIHLHLYIMADKIKKSYKFSKSFYDDAITQGKWWSKLYFKLLWVGFPMTFLVSCLISLWEPLCLLRRNTQV